MAHQNYLIAVVSSSMARSLATLGMTTAKCALLIDDAVVQIIESNVIAIGLRQISFATRRIPTHGSIGQSKSPTAALILLLSKITDTLLSPSSGPSHSGWYRISVSLATWTSSGLPTPIAAAIASRISFHGHCRSLVM